MANKIIENYYPRECDLAKKEIKEEPEYFFHASYFGLQVYLCKSRGLYVVKTLNFVPTFSKDIDYRYIISHDYLTIYSSHDFQCAVFMYQKTVSDLLYQENLKHLNGFDVADLSPYKYPKEVNLIRKVFC